ncbi:hypothetical protein Q0812_09710 [Brevundimonas sp. 2R-24]|uniref:Glycerophosphoryl diester phosphodiesterase membrane domain-containing protein n=1 Tax=Peiella sedimenti TaxID=3061083 RepID=A0ABT8SQL6_9CAUL|nr:hypothetical protein [Caulobacteraceae bacterium XZ-24]
MKTFSIGDAALEPFRLAFGRPLSTFVWGLVLLAPLALMGGATVEMFRTMIAHASDPEGLHEALMAQSLGVQLWAQLAQLLQVVFAAVVSAAMIRAVFAGRGRDRALFLRIGMTELYVLIVLIAVAVGLFVAAVLVGLLLVGLGALMWGLPEGVKIPAYVLMGAAYVVGLLLLWGRLALIAPATVRSKTLAFEPGWKAGRGQTLRLFLMLLLSWIIGVVVSLIVWGVLIGVAVAAGAALGVGDAPSFDAWLEGAMANPALLWGGGGVLLLIVCWMQGLSQLMMVAPYARALQNPTPEA